MQTAGPTPSISDPAASIFFFRVTERASRGGAERERERERIPSGLHTVSAEPDIGLEPRKLGHQDPSGN